MHRMTIADVLDLDATAQADLIRRKQISALELAEASVRRAEAVNPRLNAVVTPLYDQAIDTARGTFPDGPFAGVPFLVKDLIASVAGARKTDCSAFLRDNVATADSELVSRYRRAGLNIIGLTNASEFGLLPTTEPALFGPTKNPWNLAHSPGGSSGGSAAAVAARIAPMGHANDWGGSIRIPAACCGLFGMKPTRGRNSLGPRFGDMLSGLVHEHAVTISVRDSAALLDATAGYADGDPHVAPIPARPYVRELGASGPRLRIGLWTRPFGGSDVHEDCLRAARDAAKLCEELGHVVEETDLAISAPIDTIRAFVTIYAAGTAALMDDWGQSTGRAPTPEGFEPLTWALAGLGRSSTAADYLGAVTTIQRAARDMGRLMSRFDALLSPTIAEPPAVLGSFEAPENAPLAGFMRAGSYVPFLTISNMTGQPSMSMPLSWNDASLPIGVMFTGRFGDESTLFRLASELETARPWSSKRPTGLA
jgi:amidase